MTKCIISLEGSHSWPVRPSDRNNTKVNIYEEDVTVVTVMDLNMGHDRDGSRNVGLIVVQPPEAAASPRNFY